MAYPGILFGGGVQIQLKTEDRDNGELGGGSPLVRGSGGSCNLVQKISFHTDRLCGLVVRVSGYRYRGLGVDSRRYQIF